MHIIATVYYYELQSHIKIIQYQYGRSSIFVHQKKFVVVDKTIVHAFIIYYNNMHYKL